MTVPGDLAHRQAVGDAVATEDGGDKTTVTRRVDKEGKVDSLHGESESGAMAVWLGVLIGIPNPEQLDSSTVARVRMCPYYQSVFISAMLRALRITNKCVCSFLVQVSPNIPTQCETVSPVTEIRVACADPHPSLLSHCVDQGQQCASLLVFLDNFVSCFWRQTGTDFDTRFHDITVDSMMMRITSRMPCTTA